MTTNPYDDAIQSDPTLRQLLSGAGPAIASLDKVQLEKLIFYLKAIHGFYPNSENHVAYWTEFSKTLGALRESAEQRELQAATSKKLLLGMGTCFIAGAVVGPNLGSLGSYAASLGLVGAAVAAIGLVLFADLKLFKRGVEIAKEQDRKYFLASLRAARACNELDWAGLFAYHSASKSGPHSDADLERNAQEVGALSASLRNALYNDEFFQYTSVTHVGASRGDA